MKHAGDLTAAAALADEARCMDLADRYINSECVKRMLQADQVLKLLHHLWCSLVIFLSAMCLMGEEKIPFEGEFGGKNCCLVHKRR